MTRYAQQTQVPVERSRAEAAKHLQRLGASGVQWTDDWREGKVTLQFYWTRENRDYLARFTIHLPDDEVLREECVDLRNGSFSESKYQKALASLGRQEHRTLVLWLKACVHAIEEELISPEQVFLPYLVTRKGTTVGEEVAGSYDMLVAKGPVALLGDGGTSD
jgi:hypothetical protein